MSNEIMEEVRKFVVDNGDDVGMGEPVCLIHKADHNNCEGCPSELGCSKYSALLLNHLDTIMYKPNSFDDYKAMNERVASTMARILKSKTPDEVILRAIGKFGMHEDSEIVRYRKPTLVEGPVMPPTQTDSISRIIATIHLLRVDMRCLDLGQSCSPTQVDPADGTAIFVGSPDHNAERRTSRSSYYPSGLQL